MRDYELTGEALAAALEDPALESMNFLNEIASCYPGAVSFASGRPTEDFFDVADIHRYIDTYCEYLRRERGYDEAMVRRELFQYGRTKGLIHELIARHLDRDEGIYADPEAVVVTVGFQEAMFITLRALRASDRDVLLAVSPAYVGLTGAARLADLPVLPVRSGGDGVELDHLASQVATARARGLRPRACYLMPDFANPSGMSLTIPQRRALLKAAAEQDILLLEDNPYGLFHDGEHTPTLKALDRERNVIYLGSLAKTGFPGLRVGYVLADQRVLGRGLLADELSKIKSMVTVNTSAVAQAVAGGKLLRHGCSLRAANQRETATYLRNMGCLLAGLDRRFPNCGLPAHRFHNDRLPDGRFNGSGVTWNRPSGGFFAVVTTPFPADDKALEYSAREHGVLWMPMRHFCMDDTGDHQLRLACSQLSEAHIETGLDRFAAFVTSYQSYPQRRDADGHSPMPRA